MKKRTFLITVALIYMSLCKAQIGNYKWAFGFQNGSVEDIKTNDSNDIFVAVNGSPVDADPTSYYYGLGNSNPGGGNGSLIKYDQNKNLIWGAAFTSTTANGFGINSIYVQHNSFVYVIGTYEGTVDADPGPGITNYTSNGGTDICIIKLNQSGQFVWAKSIGGSSDDNGVDISVDNSGNVFVGAMFKLTIDCDPGTGIVNSTSNGYTDFLLLKLDAAGNYNWSFTAGNTDYDYINKVITFGADVYIFGISRYTVDFDPGAASTFTINSSQPAGYMAKYTNTGSLVKVRQLVASEINLYDADINKSGTLVVSGNYKGTIETNSAGPSYTLGATGYREGFIARYDTSLQVQFALTTAGNISDYYSDCFFYGIATDSLQNIYVSGGFTEEIDFDPSPSVNSFATTGISGDMDIIMLKYSSTGQYIGGFKLNNGNSQHTKTIAIDKTLQYYIAGSNLGAIDYDPAITTATMSLQSYVVKYGPFASKTNTLNINICHGQTYNLNGTNYTSTGAYKEVFYLANGNDSIVYLNLTVQNTNPYIVAENSVLKSQAPAGSVFQWIDCSTNANVPGATSYSYAPVDNHSYAAKITYAGCTDTTDCFDAFASANSGVPAFNWVYYGGGWGMGRSIVTDNYDNVYVTGGFNGVMDIDFSSGTKSIQASSTSVDIFLSKYDNNGNYIWSVPMGTSGTSTYVEKGESVFVDDQQNVYVAGTYQFPFDIDPGPGTYTLNDPAAGCCSENIFLAKFNANGQLIWAKGMGGSGYVYLYNMSVDKAGNIAIVGEFNGTFDIDPGAGIVNLAGGTNALSQGYLAKFDNNGTLLSAMSFTTNTTSVHNNTRSVAFDKSGNMLVSGDFTGTMDFDPTASTYNQTSAGPTTTDIFYAKYSPSMQLLWAKRMGASATSDFAGYIVAGQNNNFYMSGKGGLVPVARDFAAKFDSMGVLKTTFSYTASGNYYLPKLSLDDASNVYVTGTFDSNLNFGSGVTPPVGAQDFYIAKFGDSGPVAKWWFRLGSMDNEMSHGVAADQKGNIFVTGFFNDTIDFDPSVTGTSTLSATSGGLNFIAKYGQGCAPINTVSIAGTGSVTVNAANSFYEWKDCATNQIVASTTTNTFYPVATGQYKAIIHQGQCIDSTVCQTVSVVVNGLHILANSEVLIYPVPSTDFINIESPKDNIDRTRIFNVNGQLISERSDFDDGQKIKVSLEQLKTGVYILEIISENNVIARKKIIKSGH